MNVIASVSLFGETREIELIVHGDALDTVSLPVVGKFPTGTKLHRSQLRLWKRHLSTGRTLRGDTVAVVDGEEYVADFTLYTHNRNVGRIIGWFDAATTPETVVARW